MVQVPMSLRELPLNPDPVVLADVGVDGVVVVDVEPANSEASNSQLVVSVVFLLAPSISEWVVRIQPGAALDMLHEHGDGRIKNVGHFVAWIPADALLLIGI